MQQKITTYSQQFTSYHQQALEVSSGRGALLAVGLACTELKSRRGERKRRTGGRGRRVREEEEEEGGRERREGGRGRMRGGKEGEEGRRKRKEGGRGGKEERRE